MPNNTLIAFELTVGNHIINQILKQPRTIDIRARILLDPLVSPFFSQACLWCTKAFNMEIYYGSSGICSILYLCVCFFRLFYGYSQIHKKCHEISDREFIFGHNFLYVRRFDICFINKVVVWKKGNRSNWIYLVYIKLFLHIERTNGKSKYFWK